MVLFSFNLGFLGMTKGPATKEEGIHGYLGGSWQFSSQLLLECFRLPENMNSMQAVTLSVWDKVVTPALAAVSDGHIPEVRYTSAESE